jgi:hypothetical protein
MELVTESGRAALNEHPLISGDCGLFIEMK